MKMYFCDICEKQFDKKKRHMIIIRRDNGSTYHFNFNYSISWSSEYFDICPSCLKDAVIDLAEKWSVDNE